MNSNKASQQSKNKKLRRQAKRKQELAIESLEQRNLMAIDLVSGILQITGGLYQDEVSILTSRTGEITATRKETILSQNPTTESKTFSAAAINAITVRLSSGNDSVNNGTSKAMTAYGGNGNDFMRGGSGADKLFGEAGDDTLNGYTGNDILRGGTENDTIYGFAGDDSIHGEDGNDTLNGGDGLDLIQGGLGADIIRGDADGDSLYGLFNNSLPGDIDGNNVMYGGDGNDLMKSAAGVDYQYGGSGTDSLYGGSGNDVMYGEGENDFMLGQDGNDWLEGSVGDDILSGGNGNDKLYGHDGNDNLLGDSGNDSLYGGNQNDKLYGHDGDDLMQGNNGHDVLDGGDGADDMTGGANDDYLKGQDGNDFMHGNTGNDTLLGGNGTDTMYGGLGIDKIVAIDGAADLFFGGDTAANSDRDELWSDGQDALVNLTVINNAKAVDPKAVHVINSFRSYTVNSLPQTTPMTLGAALADPSPVVDDIGGVYLSKSETGNVPLFPTTGIAYNNIDQGATGTCYFLARLSSLAKTHPQHIVDMVTEMGDGSYAVQFYNQSGGRVFVRVDSDFYRANSNDSIRYAHFGPTTGMWAAVIEKAWAIHRYGTGSYDVIEGGNSATVSTSKALGLSQIDVWAIDNTPTAFVNAMKVALAQGRSVIMSAPAAISNSLAMTPSNQHWGQHVFVVHSIDTDASGNATKVKLYNLYGGGLTEITDFTRLQFFASKAAIIWPS